jgi:hypothetical protein
MEAIGAPRELSIDQLYDDVLSVEDYEKALALHTYVLRWVLAPENLDTHSRTMFMYACAHGKIGSAVTILMGEFGRADSTISPSEPSIWIEWSNYWQRGFDPIGTNPAPSSVNQIS